MFCQECGKPIATGIRYCTNCGTHVSEQAMQDKAATTYTAIRELTGVDGHKLLNRPEITHLPSILEEGEMPECVTTNSHLSIAIATDRRIINIKKSYWNDSINKVESYPYADILSIKAGRGISEHPLAIEISGKIHRIDADKETRFTFAEFVAGRIRLPKSGETGDKIESAVKDSGPIKQDLRGAEINVQIKNLDDMSRVLGYREIKELPNILWDSEHIYDIVQGLYDSGRGILVSTDRRLIFVNKGMIYGLKVEDFPNDKITSIQYEIKLLLGSITIFASGNKAVVEYVNKKRARAFAEGVRARLAAGSEPVATPTATRGDHTEDDVAGQLEKLATLKEKGILTEEEFAAKKKQILGI